ncbi:MAG: 2-hydroxyacid dehydrogenase [Pseudomonadota bacterium]
MKDISLLISARGHLPTREALTTQFASITNNGFAGLTQLEDEERHKVKGIACLFDTIDGQILDAFPNLEIISSFGVGYDHIDAQAAADRNIVVTHTPGVLDDEVADTAIGLLLNTIRRLPAAETYLRDGKWETNGSFPLTPLTLRQRSVGIYGMGRIGKAIAKRLEGFGVGISYHNRSQVDGVHYRYCSSLMELAETVDTLINVVPATPETEKSINASVLKKLGKHGVLINVGRGSTVSESDLAKALHDGTIAAAGLDVFAEEPRVPEALMTAPNTVLLPHVASASEHTRMAMGQLVIDNLVAWFSNREAITPVPETQHLNRKSSHA